MLLKSKITNRLKYLLDLAPLGALLFTLMGATEALAWGRQGHATICQVAAHIASSEPRGEFLKKHSFDLGYYCNVPDLVWKKTETYDFEWFNHFHDVEIFERGLKDSKIKNPYDLDRQKFNAAFPEISDEAGRAFWRVRELSRDLQALNAKLKSPDLEKEERHQTQADWLLRAGAAGHYIGDLAQPLHVTENYNGQLTDQKGIHAFFEEELVDLLYLEPKASLLNDVMQLAAKDWPAYKKSVENLTLLELLQKLTDQSYRDLKAVLEMDRKVGRSDLKKAASAHRRLIVKGLVAGALAQAEFYRRHVGWDYNGDRFFNFLADPPFIAPPNTTTLSSSGSSSGSSSKREPSKTKK